MSLVFALVLAKMREWYWIITLVLAVGGGEGLNVLLKHAYERARPVFDNPLVELMSYSFPSGHTAGAVVFYGVLAAFLVSRFYDRRLRAAVVIGQSLPWRWSGSLACTSAHITSAMCLPPPARALHGWCYACPPFTTSCAERW
jgi:membrane-associated phospholipid phosphatase